jgi:hypothetical protein
VARVPKTFFFDGVCLSEAGFNQIRLLSLKFAETKKRGRVKRGPSTHPGLISMLSMSSERSEDDVDADVKSLTAGMCLWVCRCLCGCVCGCVCAFYIIVQWLVLEHVHILSTSA